MNPIPFGKLACLYVGTKDVETSLRYWTEVVGAPKVWDFTAFGTRVAAVAPAKALSYSSPATARRARAS